jgi:DNA-binding response OmpR family regulator
MTHRLYHTTPVSRSSDGINALRESNHDAVMLDIFVQRLCGLDALDHIRRELSIPVIVMLSFKLRSSVGSVD